MCFAVWEEPLSRTTWMTLSRGKSQSVEEGGEGRGVVAVDGLDQRLAGGDVERGDDGDGAVAAVFELAPGPPAWSGGL